MKSMKKSLFRYRYSIFYTLLIIVMALIIIFVRQPTHIYPRYIENSGWKTVDNSYIFMSKADYIWNNETFEELTLRINFIKVGDKWEGLIMIRLALRRSSEIELFNISVGKNISYFYWLINGLTEADIIGNRSGDSYYICLKNIKNYGEPIYIQWFKIVFDNWPVEIRLHADIHQGSMIRHIIYEKEINLKGYS